MKKILKTALCLTMFASSLHAQTIIEGNITDINTGEVLPFVNVAISGTTIGTISDLNGEFSINVPANYINKEITFSSVGFSPYIYKITNSSNGRINVKLKPVDYKIDEVVVTDKSQAGRKIIKNVIENTSSNFVDCDFAYSGTYTNITNYDGKERKSVYKFNAYDSEGYRNNSSNNAFAALNYKFGKIERNFKPDDYQSGLNYFDMVSGLNEMRTKLGVFNPNSLNNFEFKIKSETSTEYVLEFNCTKPDVGSCGVWNATKYNGTITINKSDNAVKTIVYTLVINNFSTNTLSFALSGDGKATINAEINYEKFTNKYALQSLKAKITSANITIDDTIIVENVNYKVPGKIQGKVFYAR